MPKYYNELDTFFIPHTQAKQIDAQEVLYALINQSIDLSNAVTALYTYDENEELIPMTSPELLFNLVYQITNNLKLAKQAMPQALGFASNTEGK